MMLSLLGAQVPCEKIEPSDRVLLIISATDPRMAARISQDPAERKRVDRAVRSASVGLLTLLPSIRSQMALTVEGGRTGREQSVLEARAIITRAEERFRELEDERALNLIAKATAQLAAVHQESGAISLLAKAHLLAGAIYLARNRQVAARKRLRRALDLQPDLTPQRHRYAPQVISEVAALKSASAANALGRAVGRLEITVPPLTEPAEVFVDGQPRGRAPLVIDPIGEGRHLLRVSARGFQSYIKSVQIDGTRTKQLAVRLAPDEEIQRIAQLPRLLRLGLDTKELLGLLARRAEADRSLLVALTLGSSPQTGTATIGATLRSEGLGTAYASTLEREALRNALGQLLSCKQSAPPKLAPALLGVAPLRRAVPGPVPPPIPWWERPWFWAVAALTFVSVSGALVIGRTAGGPPEAIEIELTPRP